MRTSIALLIAASLTVSSCGGWKESRANPRNWFGSSEEVELAPESAEAANPLLPETSTSINLFAKPEAPDTTVLISSVTGLRVERTDTGAIIYAEGLAARQGAYNVKLRQDPDAADGTLALQFRADYPAAATPLGSERTRKLRAAYSLSDADLKGISLIRISAENNARETRR